MNASQALGLLIGLSAVSSAFALVSWLQEKLKLDHRRRLSFLKAHLVLFWVFGSASLLLLMFKQNKVVSSFLPQSEVLSQMVERSKAPALLLESGFLGGGSLLLGLYLLGLGFHLSRIVRGYLKMRTLLLQTSSVKVAGRSVRSSEEIPSPFSFGVLNPQVFVPSRWLAERSPREMEAMLAHEETHLQNKDPQWKLFSLVTRSFLFFMPTAFYLHRRLDLEMEIECDRLTMRKTDLSVSQYGNFLIDMAADLRGGQGHPMFVHMSEANNLQRRIAAMKTKTMHRPLISGLLGILIAAVSLGAVAATSGASRTKKMVMITTEILKGGKIVSAPRIVALWNESATIEVGSENAEPELRLKVTATDPRSGNIPDGIELQMEVDYKTPTDEIRAKPRLVVAPGEEGLVVLSADNGPALEMRVTAEYQ